VNQTYIALLRGINVGGRNRLPMDDLVEAMQDLGAENVRTYIQSGNAAFEYAGNLPGGFSARLAEVIELRKGFAPQVLVLTLDRLEHSAVRNPFPEAEDKPKSLHVFFLAFKPPDPDMQALEEARAESESFRLEGAVFYLHAPDGIGRSRLAAGVERALGVSATARNWRSVQKILEMAGG